MSTRGSIYYRPLITAKVVHGGMMLHYARSQRARKFENVMVVQSVSGSAGTVTGRVNMGGTLERTVTVPLSHATEAWAIIGDDGKVQTYEQTLAQCKGIHAEVINRFNQLDRLDRLGH